ncbi:hypothetical protein [Nannocystis pusilla]|uniref:hypothetical protein n=1 Tax=Nannocystis pusilla TaxID=889268 RepID=UPI003B79C946
MATDHRAAEIELPGALGLLHATAPHEFGDPASVTRLRRVQILESLRLVDDEQIDPQLVPANAGIERALGVRGDEFANPGRGAVFDQRPLAGGQVVLFL